VQRHIQRLFVTSIVALTAGCVEQRTVVLNQATAASLAGSGTAGAVKPVAPPSPCSAPRGSGPYEHLQRPVSDPAVPLPPRALAEHVRGCAGLRFRIGPAGAPQDITLVAEYPVGYGFGDAGLAKLNGLRWAPTDDFAWHYLVINQFPHS
jgi:hypothetical protein